jgi:DNA gyrase subunit B
MHDAASSIRLLSATEAIRMRPAFYVGPLDDPTLFNRFIQESLCIAADESVCGHCTRVQVAVQADAKVTVRDNGRGVPMELDQNGVTLAEHLLTKLFACREHKEDKQLAETCCEMGLVVVNALSEWFQIRNSRDGACWLQVYKRGEPEGPFKRVATTTESGVELSFKPDPSIFGQLVFDAPALTSWFAAFGLQFESTKIEAGETPAGRTTTLSFEGITPSQPASGIPS